MPLPSPHRKGFFALCLALALSAGAGGCRSEPVDAAALLIAHSSGLNHLRLGELTEAERDFRTVVDLAPNDATGHANLGLTYLRAGRFDDAESALRRARRLNRASVEITLMLARLYAMTDREDDARELLSGIGPDARALYALAELEAGAAGEDSAASPAYVDRLRAAAAADPANLALRVRLAAALSRQGAPSADSAARQLEEVRRLRPEPPREARAPLDSAIRLLQAGQADAARPFVRRFVDLIEATTPYQAALEKVQWVEGRLVGRPVIAFNPQTIVQTRGITPLLGDPDIRFTDVSDETGLSSLPIDAIAFGDTDGDGIDNLVVATSGSGPGAGPALRLYNVQRGYMVDATRQAGPAIAQVSDRVADLAFADVDNDGWLDLFIVSASGRGRLLRNTGQGVYEDVTPRARLADVGGARAARFVDVDHDGDLDLVLAGGPLRVYRNNLDGTFTEVAAEMGLAAGQSHDVAFGDFDGDGRIDLVIARAGASGGVAVFRNAGQRRFVDETTSAGLGGATAGAGKLAVGDYDNDGRLDLLVAPAGGEPQLWHNTGRTSVSFTRDAQAGAGLRALGTDVRAIRFADYDNDGWLDVVAATARGAALLRSDRRGTGFVDRSTLLPQLLRSGAASPAVVTAHDADGDGDLDLFVGGAGRVHQLRNDGGNTRLSMQVQLVGLRAGSGKNNTFGIGSRIEVRAGEIFQTRVVTDRVTHFGLGPHLKADVVRIEWTNGVPQVVYFPGTDQDVVELEQLKGSCAFLYTWDGKGFRFVTDVMWRSALGMPLGIMGGTSRTAYAPAGASQEYLRIPGDALRPRDGRYVLQLTEELWETAYVDQIRLLAVDHPDAVELFVDEKFVPPAPVRLRMYHAARRTPPRSAMNEAGVNVLPALLEKDDRYVDHFIATRYQGVVEPHDLIMDLGPDAGGANTHLFLRGWIYPTDASINVALGQQSALTASMPSLEVRNARGHWQVAIPNIGFPSGKDKTIVVDLAGLFPTADRHVRIRTSMQIYWDQAFVATDAPAIQPAVANGSPGSGSRVVQLEPRTAHLHERGFSRMYRKGGRSGPHWFDYDSVTKTSPWRPIEGAFTRFGDVLPLLGAADDMFLIMAPGDEATIEFDALPEPAAGMKRTFLLYTDGWIKDADMNTAHGNTVEPLPYHTIRDYPYAPGDAYPADSARSRYRREYNTRIVNRR